MVDDVETYFERFFAQLRPNFIEFANGFVGDRGLERTGTIAVGAHQCYFRYKHGRKPRHFADRYPDIRIAQT